MPDYKLIYFDTTGRGELIRLLFSVAGVEFEDVRISENLPLTEWNELRPNTPFGKLPMLEYEGKTICQSITIARMLARRFGLAGKDETEQVLAEMLVDCMCEIQDEISNMLYLDLGPQANAKHGKRAFQEIIPQHLQNLEKLLKKNQDGDSFFVGNELTWADLMLVDAVTWPQYFKQEVDLSECPKLKALIERVEAVPQVAAWRENHPFIDLPEGVYPVQEYLSAL